MGPACRAADATPDRDGTVAASRSVCISVSPIPVCVHPVNGLQMSGTDLLPQLAMPHAGLISAMPLAVYLAGQLPSPLVPVPLVEMSGAALGVEYLAVRNPLRWRGHTVPKPDDTVQENKPYSL